MNPKVAIFIPCYVDHLQPAIGKSTLRVLQEAGCDVTIPPSQVCCGQPAFNNGYCGETRVGAKSFLKTFEGDFDIVLPSGSCAAMIKKFYPELFQGSSLESLAKQTAKRTYEFASYWVDKLGNPDIGAQFPHQVTLHNGCHGMRELQIDQAPRQLLSKVKDLELIEMGENRTCCGFGGTFSVKFTEISLSMGQVKCDSALDTGAKHLVSGDPSCLLHIQGMLEKQQKDMRCWHLAQILDNQREAHS